MRCGCPTAAQACLVGMSQGFALRAHEPEPLGAERDRAGRDEHERAGRAPTSASSAAEPGAVLAVEPALSRR